MNRLPLAKRAQILGMLVEGNSLRSTSRMADVSINSVTKLLRDAAAACERFQDATMRDLKCKRLQVDEIWSFVYAKQKNVPERMQGMFGVGDTWTWVAMDAETKLIPTWAVGPRDGETAKAFIGDLAERLTHRVQLTTDGHKVYLEAVEDAFGADIDYAMLIKTYEGGSGKSAETRYSPAACTGAVKQKITGEPDMGHVSTSYIERQNLTMRMTMRRFSRLTNGFSKKVENHMAAVALYTMFYNFGRIHKTLRVTPAMEAGKADHVWSLEEITGLAD
jgi:IS1 family transposase